MHKTALLAFLKQPYPFYYRGRSLLIIMGIVFFMALFFSYFFRPFSVNFAEHKMDFFFICAVHALVPAMVLGLFSGIALKPGIDERWNVTREMIFLLLLLLVTGVGEFLVRDLIYDNPHNWSAKYFFEEVRNAFLVGILFITILIPLNFNRLYRKNLNNAVAITAQVKKEVAAADPLRIFIQTQLKSDDFYLEASYFILARAEGNYVEIHLQNGKNTQKLLKRITIKALELQLANLNTVVKTHRSYLVNLSRVEHVTGNAQGYKLRLNDFPDDIPVSRKLIPAFEARMQGL